MPNVFSKLNFIVLGASALTSFYGTDLVDNGFPFSFGLLMEKQKPEEECQKVDEHAKDWLSQEDKWIKQGKTLADFLLKKKVSLDLWEAVRNAVVKILQKETIYDSFLKLKSRGNTKRVLNFLIAKKRIFKEECAKDIDPNGIGKYGLAHYVCGGFKCAPDPAKFHACIKEEAPLEILFLFMAQVADSDMQSMLFKKNAAPLDIPWTCAIEETVPEQAQELWEEEKSLDVGKKLDAAFSEDEDNQKKIEYLKNWLVYFEGDAKKAIQKILTANPQEIREESFRQSIGKALKREIIRADEADRKDNFEKKAKHVLEIVKKLHNDKKLFTGFFAEKNDNDEKKKEYIKCWLKKFDGDRNKVLLKLHEVDLEEIKNFAW